MSKYRILQKCDKFFIQRYSETGLICKKYVWLDLGYYDPYDYRQQCFIINYYDSLDEAKTIVDKNIASDIKKEQWVTSKPKVVYETK